MTYIVLAKHGPKGIQSGYVVQEIDSGKIVAAFTNRASGYWRWAKDKAQRECDRLNIQAEG